MLAKSISYVGQGRHILVIEDMVKRPYRITALRNSLFLNLSYILYIDLYILNSVITS